LNYISIAGIDTIFYLFSGMEAPLYYEIQVIIVAMILVIFEYFIVFKRGSLKDTVKKEL
jgi:hypothetical protein